MDGKLTPEYAQWLLDLKCEQVYVRVYGTSEPDSEAWLGYFEDGLTPEQAMLEDLSHADAD